MMRVPRNVRGEAERSEEQWGDGVVIRVRAREALKMGSRRTASMDMG